MADLELMKRIHNALRQAGRVLVIADNRPDGDCVGSSTALYHWLKNEGKEVTLFYNGQLPSHFRFIDGYYDFTNDPTVFDRAYDAVITVDGGDLEHIKIVDLLPRIPKGYTLINIDHHSTNDFFGDLNLVDTTASSTCEIVFRLFEANGMRFDDKIATSLMTGLCTDTGHFSNPATNAVGMAAAGKLCSYGARHTDILKHLVANQSVDSFKLLGLALERLQYNKRFDMAITYFLNEDFERLNLDREEARGVVEFLNANCQPAGAVMLLREHGDGTVKGTIRSIERDISKLAEQLGGGGHKKASGFTIKGKIEVTDGLARIVP